LYTTVREYQVGQNVVDELARRHEEVERALSASQGFISYALVKTAHGMLSVTTCETAAGTEDSSRRAADWLREQMPQASVQPPVISGGTVIASVGRRAPAAG
jgi:hypothetical protein